MGRIWSPQKRWSESKVMATSACVRRTGGDPEQAYSVQTKLYLQSAFYVLVPEEAACSVSETLPKAWLLCSRWATESAFTACQGLCINPAYCMPGVVHKAHLLCAGDSAQVTFHAYDMPGSLHKAHLLCAKSTYRVLGALGKALLLYAECSMYICPLCISCLT